MDIPDLPYMRRTISGQDLTEIFGKNHPVPFEEEDLAEPKTRRGQRTELEDAQHHSPIDEP